MAEAAKIREGLDYLRRCIREGVRYVGWNGVWPPNQPIFYNTAGPAPSPERVADQGILCAGAINLFERAVDKTPNLDTWGTLAIERNLKNKRAFNIRTRYPVGTILGYPFARDNDGHVVIVSTPPDENGDQWTIGADRQYGLNEKRTVRSAHQIFNFTYAGELEGVGVIPLGGGGGDNPDNGGGDKPVWGLDVSSHQGRLNMRGIKNEGYSFLFQKASEGTYYPNNSDQAYYVQLARNNVKDAKAAGLLVGWYHYLTNGPVGEQVDNFLRITGKNLDGYMVMVDVEALSYDGVDYSPQARHVQGFIRELRKRIGDHPIIIYSADWFWKPKIGRSVKDLLPELTPGKDIITWDAEYVVGRAGYASVVWNNALIQGGRKWQERWGGVPHKILQFTDQAWIDSANKAMDANRANATLSEMRVWANTSEATPEPEPEPGPDPEPKRRTWSEPEIRAVSREEARKEISDQLKEAFPKGPSAKPVPEEEPMKDEISREERRAAKKAERAKARAEREEARGERPVKVAGKRGAGGAAGLYILTESLMPLFEGLPPEYMHFLPLAAALAYLLPRVIEGKLLDE